MNLVASKIELATEQPKINDLQSTLSVGGNDPETSALNYFVI
jgi:hypothetical protein